MHRASGMNSSAIADLMGHVDTTMVEIVYARVGYQKNADRQKKNRFLMEAASNGVTKSRLAGGVYRARTYDLHDVNVAL